MVVFLLGIYSEWFLVVGWVQVDGSVVDFCVLFWCEYCDDGVCV